ncbi:MAG: apolipoprotein N-acyltransferase [Candidatus Omnitrophica bacterium]|nr:apolipoprotein N-acyltransferase [Candidatus Omnitrophota bacterium]
MIRLALVFFSAVVLYFAFPNVISIEGCPPLAWVALVPFLRALDAAPLQGRFLLGLLWGGVVFLLLVHWLMPVSVGGYLIFALALALGPVVFSVLAVSFSPSFFSLFYIPCAWVVSEGLRSWILGGFTWSVAYSQAFYPEQIHLAAWGGVYAVAWVIVFVNMGLYWALKTHGPERKKFLIITAVAFLLNLSFGMGSEIVHKLSRTKETWRVGLVQPNISREDKTNEKLYDENVAPHLRLTKQSVVKGAPDLIIWPETAFPDDILKDFKWRPRVSQVARNFKVNFLIGSALMDDAGHDLNSALLVSPDGEWRGLYNKIKLVPFSEYSPFDNDEQFFPQISAMIKKSVGVTGYHFIAGKAFGVLSVGKENNGRARMERLIGVSICSEEAYPLLFRELAKRDVSFLVVMLNDGWFKAPEALMMHAQNAPFRAVETGRAVVRAANTGLTIVFSPDGMALGASRLPLQNAGFSLADVPSGQGTTLYTILGDIFLWLCAAFVIISWMLKKKRRGSIN